MLPKSTIDRGRGTCAIFDSPTSSSRDKSGWPMRKCQCSNFSQVDNRLNTKLGNLAID